MEMLRLSRTTLWRLRTKGLPTVAVGRTVRYNIDRVQQWLDQTGAPTIAGSPERNDADALGRAVEVLPDCHWSLSVALDPKHRPQEPNRPASTVRREWWRYPQEAHLLDRAGSRYRRLTAEEIGRLQGFPIGWGTAATKDELLLIRGYGDAVPPLMAERIAKALPSLLPRKRIWKSVEICAGFGGLALGMSRALNINHVALLERWPVACEVLRTCGAFPPERVQEVDLKDFDWKALAGQVELLSGGPPCQPWSVAGQGLGEEDDRDLLGGMPEVISTVRPALFVFENVPGLLSGENEAYARNLVDRLRNSAGPNSYGVAMGVFNAADFGVPQRRRRVFIVGAAGRSTSEVLRFFDRVHGAKTHADPRYAAHRGLAPWTSIASSIRDWREPKRQWYRWPQEPEAPLDTVMANLSEAEQQQSALPVQRRSVRVGIDWPSRGFKVGLSEGGGWSVRQERDELSGSSLTPLLPAPDGGHPLHDPWYVTGDPMVTLDALRRTIGRRSKLAYLDVPRIRTNAGSFDASEREAVLDTWLTVVQGLLRRAYALLDDDGALAALCGIEETHFVRMLLDEIAGPGNHLGTIAWQKGYSPRNMPNMREVSPTHDNLLLFARRVDSLPPLALKVPPEGFVDRDGDPRGPWNAEQKGANKPDCDYEVNICPYRWTISSGELPPGIWRINPKSGVIWGRGADLNTAGRWSFTVRVTDQAGKVAERTLEIEIGADNSAPAAASIPWLERIDGLDAKGRLRIETATLPAGRLGADYSACVMAAGGTPWRGTTRPGKTAAAGKGRYWEFPLKTLVAAAAEDRVDFKSRDDAIPALKSYLNGATYTMLNQASVWLGASKRSGSESDAFGDVGYSQDAKKELASLSDEGVISEKVGFSKPARLMTRLLALFDRSDGFVIDVGSPAAEMASIATALGRPAVYVEVRTDPKIRSGLLVKRLTHAARGRHPVPGVVDFLDRPRRDAGSGRYFLSGARRPDRPDSRPYMLNVGSDFAQVDRSAATCFIDYANYPDGAPTFLQALASVEGLVALVSKRQDGVFATTVDGSLLAIHFEGTTKLDGRSLDGVLSSFDVHMRKGGRLRIYYHRGAPPADASRTSRLEFRRVPYDLKLSAGIA